jgi:hypothetical protein
MFIRRKKFNEILAAVEQLTAELEKLQEVSMLTGIERKGRENLFTFLRGGEVIQIKTMGLMSDNMPEWKAKLLR